MLNVIDEIYYRARSREIKKAEIKLKRTKTSSILQCLTKECWNSNIQYSIVIKTSDMLIVEIYGGECVELIKYQKVNKVMAIDIRKFLDLMDSRQAQKGVYISPGYFEDKCYEAVSLCSSEKKIKLVNGFEFIKFQLGIMGTTRDIFEKKKIRFYKYLPD